jgi:hypothetical protein
MTVVRCGDQTAKNTLSLCMRVVAGPGDILPALKIVNDDRAMTVTAVLHAPNTV